MDDKRTILDSKDQPNFKDISESINVSKEEEVQNGESGYNDDDDIIDLDQINPSERGVIKNNEEMEPNGKTNNRGLTEEGSGIHDIKYNPITFVSHDVIEKTDKCESEKYDIKSIDLNSMPKEEAIEFLMSRKLEMKKKPGKIMKNSKYDKIKSHFETDKLHHNSYQRPTDISEKDPETTYDFNTACTKFLANLLKGSNQNYNKLIKLMIYNSKIEEIKKLENSEPNVYYSKVNMYLKKKQKILESIQEKMNEEFNSKHTFFPQTNINRSHEIFDFKLFLDNQNKFQQKVVEKVSLMKIENEKKDIIQGHPIISENTIKIFNEKVKINNDPAFLRLYNKRNEEKKSKHKHEEGNLINQKKFDKTTIEELINRLYKEAFSMPDMRKELEKEYFKLKTKENFSTNSSNKIILKKFIKQYKTVLSELENKPETSNKSVENSKSFDVTVNTSNGNVTTANITTNVNQLYSSENVSEQTSNNNIITFNLSNPRIVGGTKNDRKSLKLNLGDLNKILIKLKFTSKEKENSLNTTIVNFNESSLKQKEKKLVNELYENLKDSEGNINKDQLFIFLLSVLNLYEFYLVKMNIDKFNTKEIIKELKDKELLNKKDNKTKSKSYRHIKSKSINESFIMAKQDTEEEHKVSVYVIEKINTEILSKIKTSKKYCGYDEKGFFYITIQMSKTISKEFNLFAINWLDSLYDIKKLDSKPTFSQNKNMTFRPYVSEKSKKLSINFRRKIQSEVESHIGRFLADRNSINIDSDKFNLNYVKLLLIKKQKDEKQLAKKKEEIESKELKQCTFKPKINTNYESNTNYNQTDSNRLEVLYKSGVSKIIGRKDRPKEDFDQEKYGKNCSFKPQTRKLPDFKNTDYFEVDYSEKEYVNKFNRLKAGRLERKIKDIIHSREPFSSKIDIKEIKKISLEQSVSPRKELEKNVEAPSKSKSLTNMKELTRKNKSSDSCRSKTTEEEKNNSQKNEKHSIKNKIDDKKDLIPLLIIDVNIRPGDKKKIYVFDGDTAEGLSEKFSRENGLDNETKIKLKVLIQNHMSKLLMRIEEENHSLISESSSKQVIF